MTAINLVLVFIEGDQSGNQQAQMSICLFLFCRFYMVDLKLGYRNSHLKRYNVKKLRKILKRKTRKVHVDKDLEKAQSEKDCHSKNRGGKKPN